MEREGHRQLSARRVRTIGVYGWTLEAFFAALRQANVTLLLDVRQRRGVRGAEYAWANANRLQKALSEAGIAYRHERALAPTAELRQLQYREDERVGVGQRSRVELATGFRKRFTSEVLDRLELGSLVAELPVDAASALICVERDPEACHRSLIADRLAAEFAVEVEHLRP